MNLPLELLQEVKAKVIGDPSFLVYGTQLLYRRRYSWLQHEDPYEMGELRIGIKGNPSFGNIRVLMLGVKNGLSEATSREPLRGGMVQ